ncbi:MAG: DUF2064 domain-containing protein [Vicinamibacterales bacterium]
MPVRLVPAAGRIVVAMVTRAPAIAQRDVLGSGLTTDQGRSIREALLVDSLDILRRISNVAPVVVYDPPESRAEIRRLVPPQIAIVGRADGPAVGLLTGACRGFLAMGARGVVFLGGSTPDLPASRIRQAVASLTEDPQRIVLGSGDDGGCYLLGITGSHGTLLSGITWGAPDVCPRTRRAARAAGLSVVDLEPWSEVHTLDDVMRMATRRTRSARRTRAWARALRRSAPVSG